MAPCKVVVVLPPGGDSGGRRLDLIVPYTPDMTFRDFIDVIRARALKHSQAQLTLSQDSLRLNSEDGFIIDADDKVEDIMTTTEILFVSSTVGPPTVAASSHRQVTAFQIRVVTPLTAQQYRDVRQIALLNRHFSADSTLREIRADIATHLGASIADTTNEVSGPGENCYGDATRRVPSGLRTSTIDLHTAEGPVETPNFDLTVGDSHLADLVVNGVLLIYAVERRIRNDEEGDKVQVGKDAMFKAALHWEILSRQSDRGTAAFLSCLRVFAHITGTEEFNEYQQNEVLRLYHQLTVFPPAVRAMHILMQGKTLRKNECAVLVQCTSAILQDLIPKNIIENDSSRALEGTRLLFGLLLHRCQKGQEKHIAEKNNTGTQHKEDAAHPEGESFAYLYAYHTVDLRDIKTQAPVVDPIQTNFGLMEKTTYYSDLSNMDAFNDPPGISRNTSEDLLNEVNETQNVVKLAAHSDMRALRVAKLFGGVAPETTYYDADVLAVQYLQSEASATGNLAKELSQFSMNLPSVAMLCEETSLTVLEPKALSAGRHPCLTLDRDGHVAVYTGPAACAPPDRDKTIYQPIIGKEIGVDCGIIQQLLEPILRRRERDGTYLFDLFSTSNRKTATPTELIVFCVDCSYSMDNSSNFQEINESHEEHNGPSVQEDVQIDSEDADEPITFEEAKDWILSHESLNDMLALTRNAKSITRSRAMAKEIVKFLRTQLSREIAHLAYELRKTMSWASAAYLSTNRSQPQIKMNALRRTLSGLNLFEAMLCDLILFKAKDPSFQPDEYVWRPFDPIPTSQRTPAALVDLTTEFTVPAEYICPIGHVFFQDPVITSDGFTFERRSIERWYRIRRSSPLTGLPVSNISVRRNQPLYDRIQLWVQGLDLVEDLPSTPKRNRSSIFSRSNSDIRVTFVAPSGTFSRTLRRSSTLAYLHKIVFRGMRGVYVRFALHFNGRQLATSEETLEREGITSDSEIVATPVTDTPTANTNAGSHFEEMCLIKIYSPNSREIDQDFAYWVPRNTPLTLGAVVFKFWRYFQHGWNGWESVNDREVWSKIRYGGDGRFIGEKQSLWDGLALLLNHLSPTELLPTEAMCEARDDDKDDRSSHDKEDSEDGRSDSTISLTDLDGIDDVQLTPARPAQSSGTLYRVLKLELALYQSPELLKVERKKKLRTLTRMDISKQVFGSFINRLIAYNYPMAIGLVTFGTKTDLSLRLTDTVENFRNAIDNMETAGDTALWDALAIAADHLVNQDVTPDSRNLRKRIICLSDGCDTKSIRKVQDVCRSLVQHSIVVDSCSIGDEDNEDLRTLSYVTGGYKFVPKTLEEAVAVCELEPVLSLHERPPVVRPVSSAFLTASAFSLASSFAQPDPVNRDVFPKRKPHPNIADSFVRVTALERTSSISTATASAETTTLSGLRTRRLLMEIREIAGNEHQFYDVYVSESNMGFWKIVICGPTGSAYSTGTFIMYLDFGEDYPRAAPKGRFVTAIFHPNINRHGRICHSIFDRNWTSDTTCRQVLDTVFGLLLVPEFTDPINTVVTLDYYWDEVAFKAEVEKHIAKHAAKGRAELSREILGEE